MKFKFHPAKAYTFHIKTVPLLLILQLFKDSI